MDTALNLDFGPVVSDFIWAAAMGYAREVAAFGTRGDGKTWGALATMIAHAKEHHARGYPLPVKWAGVTDTFRSHEEKTLESLRAPGWRGVWTLRDQDHEAVCGIDGQVLVRVRLFGIEDQGAMNRLRMETTGLWFEEPAPALAVSSGIDESAWALGLTSQRLASHCKPAIITSNYPDEDHWTWQRFVVRQHPGSLYFRIPPGERASAADRAEWAQALEGRPDLKRRLLEGRPGMVLLGKPVAQGFNEDLHAPLGVRIRPEPGLPVHIGQDAGLTPTSVIGQRVGPRLRVIGALTTPHGGIKQLVEDLLLPWLAEHTPWALEDRELLHVYYDPAMNKDSEADSDQNTLRVMQGLLRGQYSPGAVQWESRKNALLRALNGMALGEPITLIDRVQAKGLVSALTGAWHYKTSPGGGVMGPAEPVKNHPASDFGDAFCYLAGGVRPARDRGQEKPLPRFAVAGFDPIRYHRARELQGRAASGLSR